MSNISDPCLSISLIFKFHLNSLNSKGGATSMASVRSVLSRRSSAPFSASNSSNSGDATSIAAMRGGSTHERGGAREITLPHSHGQAIRGSGSGIQRAIVGHASPSSLSHSSTLKEERVRALPDYMAVARRANDATSANRNRNVKNKFLHNFVLSVFLVVTCA